MSARRKLPPAQELEKLVDKGLTHQQIAEQISEEIGEPVSRSAVAVALSRANRTRRTIANKAVPWVVRPEHQNRYDLHMLRVHRRIESGKDVRASDLDRYHAWVQHLKENDAVIHYEPRSQLGFWLVPRRHGVDKGLIREPEPTDDDDFCV